MPKAKACYSSAVVCTDEFLELPLKARWLYVALGFETDTDGAITGIKGLLRKYEATEEDLRSLTEAGYLLEIEGVLVVRDFWVNNNMDRANYSPGAHSSLIKSHLAVQAREPYKLLSEWAEGGQQTDDRLEADFNASRDNVTGGNVTALYQCINRPLAVGCEVEPQSLLTPCPNCGKPAPHSLNELGQTVVDCHACGEVTTLL